MSVLDRSEMWLSRAGHEPVRTRCCPGHVGIVQIRLAIFADKLSLWAIECGSIRTDCVDRLAARQSDTSGLLQGQPLRVACDDVCAQTGGEFGTET